MCSVGVPVVQDFECVAVEDRDDLAREICRNSGAGEKDMEECGPEYDHLGLGGF